MLEISKVQFVEKEDEYYSNMTRIRGGLKIQVEVCVDEGMNASRKTVYDKIREEIWNKVYGDLREPLAILQNYALQEVPTKYLHEVQKRCNQINDLLAFKSPKE
jgi:hypothetical protein